MVALNRTTTTSQRILILIAGFTIDHELGRTFYAVGWVALPTSARQVSGRALTFNYSQFKLAILCLKFLEYGLCPPCRSAKPKTLFRGNGTKKCYPTPWQFFLAFPASSNTSRECDKGRRQHSGIQGTTAPFSGFFVWEMTRVRRQTRVRLSH